jgi:hypothetical protein
MLIFPKLLSNEGLFMVQEQCWYSQHYFQINIFLWFKSNADILNAAFNERLLWFKNSDDILNIIFKWMSSCGLRAVLIFSTILSNERLFIVKEQSWYSQHYLQINVFLWFKIRADILNTTFKWIYFYCLRAVLIFPKLLSNERLLWFKNSDDILKATFKWMSFYGLRAMLIFSTLPSNECLWWFKSRADILKTNFCHYFSYVASGMIRTLRPRVMTYSKLVRLLLSDISTQV